MRHSGAEGSINFLLLNCPISRLATWGSSQLKVPTSRSSGAACAASALDPCISLSLGLLTSPPFASMWVFMVLAAWVCIALVAWVVPSNGLSPLQHNDEERSVFLLWAQTNHKLGSHFHLRTIHSGTYSNLIHFTCVSRIRNTCVLTFLYTLKSTRLP